MRPETRKSMEMLFTARWNLPRAARHANLTNKEMKITFNEYACSTPRLMRLNNLKIYCQTEEDQSEMFDFLFYEYQNDIKYCTWELRRRPWVMGNVH